LIGLGSSIDVKEIRMIGKLSLAAGLLALGVAFAPQASTAAQMSLPNGITADRSDAVQDIRWRRSYCSRWNRECRARWGAGRDYRRCMRRHGC
jgi:hypothetical protein